MAIEKKSLVNRASVKKTKIASQPSESNGENKPLKAQSLKVESKAKKT